MEYPLKSYELTSLATLEQFWWDMYEICTNTPLGISANVNGQEITVEVSPGPTTKTFVTAVKVSVLMGHVRDLHQHAAGHLRQRQRTGDHCRGESRAHSETFVRALNVSVLLGHVRDLHQHTLGIAANVNGQEITVEVSPGPTFETISDPSMYQFSLDMYEICTNTPLGISANVNGQEITVEVSPGPTPETFIKVPNALFLLGQVVSSYHTRFVPTRRWVPPPTSTDRISLLS
jgi:hypothetical protein